MTRIDNLKKYKQQYIEAMAAENHPWQRKGLWDKLLFSWISPYIKIGEKLPVEFDMMPKLEKEFQHENYSNKMRYFFEEMKKEFNLADKRSKKTFILKLIFRCFKWDLLIAFFLAFSLDLLDYSTAFFIQNILEIKKHYSADMYVTAFIGLSVAMLICKFGSAVSSQYTNYFIVG